MSDLRASAISLLDNDLSSKALLFLLPSTPATSSRNTGASAGAPTPPVPTSSTSGFFAWAEYFLAGWGVSQGIGDSTSSDAASSPNMLHVKRRAFLLLLQLSSVSKLLRSKDFYDIILDKAFFDRVC